MENKLKIKICGITRKEDLVFLKGKGIDYFGVLVEVHVSKRSVNQKVALEIFKTGSSYGMKGVLLQFDESFEKIIQLTELLNPSAVQLCGNEQPESVNKLKSLINAEIWKAIHLPSTYSRSEVNVQAIIENIKSYKNAGAEFIVLDTYHKTDLGNKYGGTGKTHAWDISAEITRRSVLPVFLAGGINPDNAVLSVETVKPYGIDLASGVEYETGKKDEIKIAELMSNLDRFL